MVGIECNGLEGMGPRDLLPAEVCGDVSLVELIGWWAALLRVS